MAVHPDIAILGGGVIGLTTAYYLAGFGARVVVLDKGDLGQESSWAGAGIISPAPSPPRSPRQELHHLSLSLLPALSAAIRDVAAVDNGFIIRGGWQLVDPSQEEAARRQWQEEGILVEPRQGPELRELEPALAPHLNRALLLPTTGQVRNPRHLRGLIALCRNGGVAVQPGCPVYGFERQGDRITAAQTAAGRLLADRFLVCAGAWTDHLLAPLGRPLGVHPVRGQIALLNWGGPLLRRIVEQGKRYLVPRPDGRVLVGSTEEDAGFDKRTTAEAIVELLRFAVELVPSLAAAHVERCWAGLRPGSPDGLPFLGPLPGCDNLFVAAGHFRSGIMLSAGTGLVMAELLTGRTPRVALEGFRLDR
jgi:glycine oxidase